MNTKHNQTIRKKNPNQKDPFFYRSSFRPHCLLALACGCGFTAGAWDLDLGKDQTIAFHGFASQGFLASSDYNYLGESKDGSFEFTELGLNASYSPFKRTRIAVQGFAFDVGDVGNLEPFLDYASIEYTFSDNIGLRGGRIRRPSGIYNHIQDVDLARTSVLLPQGMYDSRMRDFYCSLDGAEVFGNISLNKAGSISYEVYGGMLNVSDDGGMALSIENRMPPGYNFDKIISPSIVGGQLWYYTPLSGLRAGVSLGEMFGSQFNLRSGPVLVENKADVFVQQYSLEYTWNNWTFQTEYLTQISDGTMYVNGRQAMTAETQWDSWYVGAAYRFCKWFEAGSYYTEYYADVHNRSGSGKATPSDANQHDLALSLRFDPKDWWILKLEGHYITGTGLLNDNANNPVRDDDGWFMLAMKTTFSF